MTDEVKACGCEWRGKKLFTCEYHEGYQGGFESGVINGRELLADRIREAILALTKDDLEKLTQPHA
jgi:hypothetical protein